MGAPADESDSKSRVYRSESSLDFRWGVLVGTVVHQATFRVGRTCSWPTPSAGFTARSNWPEAAECWDISRTPLPAGARSASDLEPARPRQPAGTGQGEAQIQPEGIARRVVRPVAHGDCPLHHGTDPLTYPPRSLGLVVPDRSEDRQCVGRGHLGHGHRPDARETYRRADCAARPALTSLQTEEPSSVPIRHDKVWGLHTLLPAHTACLPRRGTPHDEWREQSTPTCGGMIRHMDSAEPRKAQRRLIRREISS